MFNPELLTTLTTTEVTSQPEAVLIDAYDFTIQICTNNQTAKERKQAREAIAKAATYRRIVKNSLPGIIEYMRGERYKGTPKAANEAFITAKAYELAKDEAQMFVYEWDECDPFESFSNAEIRAVLYGMEIA